MKILFLGHPFNKDSIQFPKGSLIIIESDPKKSIEILDNEEIDIIVVGELKKEDIFLQKTIELIKQDYHNIPLFNYEEFVTPTEVFIGNYTPVSIKKILNHNLIPCDIYFELSDQKYINIIKAEQFYSNEMLTHLKEKGVQSLYVKKVDFKKINDFLFHELSIKQEENIALRNKVEKNIYNLEVEKVAVLQDMIHYLNADPETVERLNGITNNSIEVIKKNYGLKLLMENFNSSHEYIYSHSLMSSYLSGLVAIKMAWGTDMTLHKLSMAAILHDLSLRDDTYALVDTLEKAQQFSPQEFQLIKNHPISISTLIANISDIPPDVSHIVLCHHERPDGKGFPRGLTYANISQIAALFIICHDFVCRVYKKSIDDKLVQDIVKDQIEIYNKGNFKTPFRGLLHLLETEKFGLN